MRHTCPLLLPLFALSFTGCVLSPKDLGEEPGTDETDGSGTGQTDAGSSHTSATAGETGQVSGGFDTVGATSSETGQVSGGFGTDTATDGSFGGCDLDDPRFTCSEPMACDASLGQDSCGGLDSKFDEHGCLRASCTTHDGCLQSERCHVPALWGGCVSSHVGCEDDENGVCECFTTDDCGSGGYCVPGELWPGEPRQLAECNGSEPTDGFMLETMAFALADPDVLLLYVQTGGGCEQHEWSVCWDSTFLESLPVRVRLTVAHDANDDLCEALISDTVAVDLTMLEQAYQDAYNTEMGTISIGVADQPGSIEYTF